MLTIITAILAIGVIAGTCYVFYRSDQLDEREDELSKYSVHLDERANKLSADEETVRMLNLQLRAAIEEQARKMQERADNDRQLAEERRLERERLAAERYDAVLRAAEEATGWKLSDSRNQESSTLRTLISYFMHNEGFSYAVIGKAMRRNHSTVTHMVRKMEDWFSLPDIYREELDMYGKMIGLL